MSAAMLKEIMLTVNGAVVKVSAGTTVAVAVTLAHAASRISVSGEPRGPLCGMGICYECRVKIDGTPHCRGCQVLCESGMDVSTDD
jgi:D-hydroxyproline dehydrogenase subunit gamma